MADCARHDPGLTPYHSQHFVLLAFLQPSPSAVHPDWRHCHNGSHGDRNAVAGGAIYLHTG
jgi:hypothetical protein